MTTGDRRATGSLAILVPLLAFAVPAAAPAQQAAPDEQTVTVATAGRVFREPDEAVLMLAVESFASAAREAAADNAQKMESLLAALRRLGLGEDDIETVAYRIDPEYDRSPGEPRGPGESRLVGYRALNMVRVTISDISRVGEVIDASIAAGANRVNGLTFQLRDPDSARRDALRAAVAEARAEAQAIADALGRRLGPVVAITSAGGGPPPVQPYAIRTRAVAMAQPTPVEPGALEIEASVTAVFRLEPRP